MPIALTPTDHANPVEWVWVGAFAALLVAAVAWLFLTGSPQTGERSRLRRGFARVGDSLQRLTGLPAWCAGGVLLSLWALIVALVGFFWDVAWHIDLGRDTALFTVPHVLIIVGLAGIGLGALVSIAYATLDGADTAWRLGGLRIPRGAFILGVLSAGAVTGFPLDDLWHANYGVDVTMWGPTHLLMIGGAALAPIAQWLLLAEAGPDAGRPWVRRRMVGMRATAVLISLSAFQLEFDYGVPQWQALYQPVLIMLATSIGLVAARIALGRGWALLTSLDFVVVRGLLALVIGPGLGHVVPRFPLYVGVALVVEAVAWLVRRRGPVATALACGVGVGTLGLATEWGFSHLWGREPWQASLFPGVWAAVLIAVAGAVIGVAMGRILSGRRAGMPRAVVVAAFAGIVVGLAVPLPRNTIPVTAVMRVAPAGAATAAVNRDGLPSPYQPMRVDMVLSPPDAAQGVDRFEALSWQGGGERISPMVEVRPGEYRTAQAVPTGGSWKTLVWLVRRDVMMAAPVSMPLDLEYGQAPIVPRAVQPVTFVAATRYLMREVHGGALWPEVLAYSGLGAITLLWVALLLAGFVSLDRDHPPAARQRKAVVKKRSSAGEEVPAGVRGFI
jgi:hypothetical protein